ncbi:hypothetical protein C84B14_15211 [Salinisphaera sp. C84B14]|uniref:DUF4123 domain-containing protein n=1 Tax=Salinisphaera sp. C84B14 TaxID=1304155 RepID=UPI003341BE7F
MSSMTQYALFDGGVIAGTSASSTLSDHPSAHPLYADLGAEAAAVGPWLAEADAAIRELVTTLRADETRSVGVSVLEISAVSFSRLVDHFKSLRFIQTRSGARKYFLRYADGRAIASLWNVLLEPQRLALLGPIAAWEFTTPHGQRKKIAATQLANDTPPAMLPIRLNPKQFNNLLDESRTGELLATTIDMFPELRTVPANERYGLAQQARTWLSTRHIEHDTLRLAVTATCLRTRGAALDDQSFEQVVSQAKETAQLDAVLAWYGKV